MKTLNLHLLCLLVGSIFSFTSVAQKPFEFRCTDYLATPDRSQAKFSYDKEKNTFTINDSGTNNIAFQMDKNVDNYYYITNEQTWFAVKGSNLSTTLSNSDIWWFNGFNKGGSAEANHAVTTSGGDQLVVWNVKDNTALNPNMDYSNEQIYLSSQGNQFSHCMGLTSTGSSSTISMIGYFAPYELAATYPGLMTAMGYTADGTSLTAELKAKIDRLLASVDEMLANSDYAAYKETLEVAKGKALDALAGMAATDYAAALQIMKELREVMGAATVKHNTSISSYTRTAHGIDAMQGDVCVKIIFHDDNVVRIYKSYSADITKKSWSVVQPAAETADFRLDEADGMVTLDNAHVVVTLDLATACINVCRKDGTVLIREAGNL